MPRVTTLTHERLLELLDYDPATGFFAWKIAPSNSVKVGSRAGVFHRPSGGRYLTLDGERFMAHRVAWFYVTKEWPKHDLRAENGDYDDCRIDNFQDIPRTDLQHARKAPSTNTSGFIGVSPSSKKGKWQASITWNYKLISLGSNFETPEEASNIYQAALARLKTINTQEEFEVMVQEVRLFRRQRAVWKHLNRLGQPIGWTSFEEFTKDIQEIPRRRYGMLPIDVAKPIGPGNFKWALPIDGEFNSFTNRTEYVRAHVKNNPDHHRAKHLRKEYGADIAYERKLLGEQRGLCAICEKPEEITRGNNQRCLSLDHDHATGALRGLLCGNCNLVLGYACDDPTILTKAIAYLDKWKSGGPNVVPFKKGEDTA